MHVSKVSGLETEGASISVHLLDEVFDALLMRKHSLLPVGFDTVVFFWVALQTSHNLPRPLLFTVIFVPSCNFVKVLSEMLGENGCCIVSAWKHKSMEQVPDSNNIASFKLSWGTFYRSSMLWNLQFCFFRIKFEFTTNLYHNEASHYFGHASDFLALVFCLAKEYLTCATVQNGPVFGCYVRRSQVIQKFVYQHLRIVLKII